MNERIQSDLWNVQQIITIKMSHNLFGREMGGKQVDFALKKVMFKAYWSWGI
jgi:hypothetical protein